ncbi:MAG: hypothetical protein LUC94_01575 [Clostridiales bacterium]|nr:hypothetical protein [Clostridiales bacterium]
MEMPDTWLIVFAIIVVMAVLTWVILSGAYEYQTIDVNGTSRNVAIAGSGQAAVTMPIMAPLADALGISRQVACLAYQFGDGLSNLLWPTCGIVIICGLGDIDYSRWLKWFAKLFLILLVAQMILIEAAVVMGL